ncbi:MAG: SdpI family protein [archaeon]
MKIKHWIIFLIILSSILSMVSFKYLPDRIATHWNIDGIVNGYGDRLSNAIMFPLMMLFVVVLLYVVPLIDPLRKNVESFRKHYEQFILFFCIFFLYVQVLTLVWNLGYRYNLSKMMFPGLGLMMYFVGDFLKHTKRNWFAGIRTPWTLHSDIIWKKTHDLGSKLFKASGIIMIFGIFFENNLIVFIPLFAAVMITIGYSYMLYRKTKSP